MKKLPLDLRESILLQLGFDKSLIGQLHFYLETLLEWNQRLNLISRQMVIQDIVDNHIVDCLLPLRYFPRSAKRVADFGSGGGLPVVLFAIQFPQVQFTAFEKSVRKREFLSHCSRQITPNLEVLGEIPQKLVGYDLVVARAFKPIDVILEMSRQYFEDGGGYFLLKGRLEKIHEEMSLATKKFDKISEEIFPLLSPLLEVERHLVKIKRQKAPNNK